MSKKIKQNDEVISIWAIKMKYVGKNWLKN